MYSLGTYCQIAMQEASTEEEVPTVTTELNNRFVREILILEYIQ